MDVINVLLIEDDPMVREVNRQFIEQIKGFSLVGYASNGIEGIQKIKQLTPRACLYGHFYARARWHYYVRENPRRASSC